MLNKAEQWWRLYGVVIFGYLISTERDASRGTASIMWGPGGPGGPFDTLKQKMGERNIRQMMQEYEADLVCVSFACNGLDSNRNNSVEARKARGEDTAATSYKAKLMLIQDNKTVTRDADRSKLIVHLLHDLGMCIVLASTLMKNYTELIRTNNSELNIPKTFPWKNFADFAYKNKVKLLNWPEKAPVPSKDLRDIKSDLNSKMLKEMVCPRDYEAGVGRHNIEEDVETENDGVHIVQWDEGELLG